MIHPKIDVDGFLDTVENAKIIAFQKVRHGLAVAAPLVAFYAPVTHPGGGNLPKEFAIQLGSACVKRICDPYARTLRPTAKPIITTTLIRHIESAFGHVDPETGFDKVAGDHPAMIEFQTQVVIQTIEEHDRPELKATMDTLKRGMMSEALDLVLDHANQARELCEASDAPPMTIRLHLMQSVQAMKTVLEMMLKPA